MICCFSLFYIVINVIYLVLAQFFGHINIFEDGNLGSGNLGLPFLFFLLICDIFWTKWTDCFKCIYKGQNNLCYIR